MKKLLIPIIIFIGMGINASAQEKSSDEIKGDKDYFVYSFGKAIKAYTDAKQLTVDGQRRLAKSYYNMEQNVESEAAYSKLINESGGNLPDDYFFYIMALKSNGKYDQANTWMDKFNQQHPADLRAMDYAVHKFDIATLSKDNGRYKVEHLKVNTDAEDFGTCYYKDKIVFASSRSKKMDPERYNWNDKPFLDMYVSDVDSTQLKKPVIFDKSLDGKMHDGPASFSNNATFMAFTRNHYDLKRKELVVRIEISFSNYKDGKWSAPEPFVLNSKEYSVGHPSLTANGNTMYFTSDMPGGFGGVDVYRITKDGTGTWGKPENLGNKINTEADELYPFFEEKNGVLFFASDGRFGLGGLDIFMSELKGSEFGRAYNAGTPLNTQLDDFAVIVDSNMTKGYFSSNRPGGKGDDDIYYFDILKSLPIGKKINGIAKTKNGSLVPKTFVTLMDDKGKMIDTVTTKNDAAYTFFVDADKNFKLNGKTASYSDGDTTFNTFGKGFMMRVDVTLLQQVAEKPKVVVAEPQKVIKVGDDLAEIVEMKSIYYDYNKYDIRPDAKTELAKIIKIVNDNPTMVIELDSYADCRGTKQYNQVLSNKRANASVEYIRKNVTKPKRVKGKGYGETNLVNACACEGKVVANCSESEFQKDRRTEFIVVKK